MVDARAEVFGRALAVQERAVIDVAQEAHARNRRGRIKPERGCLRSRAERLEFSGHLVYSRLTWPVQPAADQSRESPSSVHRRLSHGVGQNFGDDVRVTFPCEAVDHVPAPPESSEPTKPDHQTADEAWKRERRIELGCGHGER
jgi:hypothetical protein